MLFTYQDARTEMRERIAKTIQDEEHKCMQGKREEMERRMQSFLERERTKLQDSYRSLLDAEEVRAAAELENERAKQKEHIAEVLQSELDESLKMAREDRRKHLFDELDKEEQAMVDNERKVSIYEHVSCKCTCYS